MQRILIVIITLLLACATSVQAKEKKEKASQPVSVKTLLKNARTAIKNSNNQSKEEKNLVDALKRDNLDKSERADILFTLAQLNTSMNDGENLKAYLKQPYDTARFFNTMLTACQYAVLCDSVDSQPNSKGKVSAKYRSKNRDMLLRYRPNIYAGGRFYLRKNDYKSSLPFFTMYYDMMELPMMNFDTKLTADTLLDRVALYAVVASYDSDQPRKTLKYVDRAILGSESKIKPLLQEYKVRCYLWIGDTVRYHEQLGVGCRLYPRHDYFFLQLIEAYDSLGQYDKGIALADSMLQCVDKRPLYWHARSVMNLRKQDWTETIAACDSVLSMQPDHVDALYNKGISILNKTMEFSSTACYDFTRPECVRDRQVIMDGYRSAEKPFEMLRKLCPDDKQKWAPALYRIYLNLNKGKEFDEIEKLLNE